MRSYCQPMCKPGRYNGTKPEIQQYKTRLCGSENRPSAFLRLQKEKHYINHRLRSLSRATTCKVREEGGETISSFILQEEVEKIDRLNVGLLPTCWGKNEKITNSSRLLFFPPLHQTHSPGYYITNTTAVYGWAARQHTHTFIAGEETERLVSETLDPTNSTFFVLENPLPNHRCLVQLCCNIQLYNG